MSYLFVDHMHVIIAFFMQNKFTLKIELPLKTKFQLNWFKNNIFLIILYKLNQAFRK